MMAITEKQDGLLLGKNPDKLSNISYPEWYRI